MEETTSWQHFIIRNWKWKESPTVIYYAVNTDGCACSTRSIFVKKKEMIYLNVFSQNFSKKKSLIFLHGFHNGSFYIEYRSGH